MPAFSREPTTATRKTDPELLKQSRTRPSMRPTVRVPSSPGIAVEVDARRVPDPRSEE
jgi:hypothetical protein